MGTDNNSFSMAGAAESDKPAVPTPSPDTAQEVTVVKFDRDYMDFRVKTGEEIDEHPKGLRARESVTTSDLPTGLEDVSKEDLAGNASLSVVRDNPQTNSEPSDSGKPTSSEAT